MNISRRLFLALGGSVAAAVSRRMARPLAFTYAAEEEVPVDFDHMILGASDLERGIAFIEERTGVRATFGGVHPGRGTQNALLALGERRYLEIMAPDPKQAEVKQHPEIKEMNEPRLIGWAAHTDDIAAVVKRAADAGFAGTGPTDGSRVRPDGKTLRWRLFNLKDDQGGLLPFFIEWGRGSVHPAADAASGCELTRLSAATPNPDELSAACEKLGVWLIVERGERVRLRAHVAGPKGEFELTS
jgi:Glyoxalase-like domain